jgi:hypothetical protein
MYAELSYFEGFHFQHIADWQEHQRLKCIKMQNIACIRSNYRLGLAAQRRRLHRV